MQVEAYEAQVKTLELAREMTVQGAQFHEGDAVLRRQRERSLERKFGAAQAGKAAPVQHRRHRERRGGVDRTQTGPHKRAQKTQHGEAAYHL